MSKTHKLVSIIGGVVCIAFLVATLCTFFSNQYILEGDKREYYFNARNKAQEKWAEAWDEGYDSEYYSDLMVEYEEEWEEAKEKCAEIEARGIAFAAVSLVGLAAAVAPIILYVVEKKKK